MIQNNVTITGVKNIIHETFCSKILHITKTPQYCKTKRDYDTVCILGEAVTFQNDIR